jgi:hypothetical protein
LPCPSGGKSEYEEDLARRRRAAGGGYPDPRACRAGPRSRRGGHATASPIARPHAYRPAPSPADHGDPGDPAHGDPDANTTAGYRDSHASRAHPNRDTKARQDTHAGQAYSHHGAQPANADAGSADTYHRTRPANPDTETRPANPNAGSHARVHRTQRACHCPQ